MYFSITDTGIISGGSLTGEHTVSFHKEYLTVSDGGGIFTNYSSTNYPYRTVRMRLIAVSGPRCRITVTSTLNEKLLLTFFIDAPELFEILWNVENLEFAANTAFDEAVISNASGHTFLGKISCSDDRLIVHRKITEPSLSVEEIVLSVEEIKDVYRAGRQKIVVKMVNEKFQIRFTELTDFTPFQNFIQAKRAEHSRFKNKELLITFETPQGEKHYGYIEDGLISMYRVGSMDGYYQFDLQKLSAYLGNGLFIIKDHAEMVVFTNTSAKEFCTKTAKVPKKLFEFHGAVWNGLDGSSTLEHVYAWYEEGHFILNSLDGFRYSCGESEVRISKQNHCCLVLPTGLLLTDQPQDAFDLVDTPEIVQSVEGLPYYFEVKGHEVQVSLLDQVVFRGKNEAFYGLQTESADSEIKVKLTDTVTILLPVDKYKEIFKETIYSLKAPEISNIPAGKLLVSRARNISDLLIFEFFGQWQVIVDYVRNQMDQESYTEEEIAQYGLYIYHATFQQRKRMEEISNRFPQFMEVLTNELLRDPKLSQIHQKQQKEMFQLTAQLKSQLMEIENLLSQITYIYYNNNEYQQRLKQAQNEASLKRFGTSTIAGLGLTLITGGVGLILPLMTIASDWSNRKVKEEMDAIQKEKEYKRNEFYFGKAVELIRHMDQHIMNYFIQQMNQLTYRNLRAEAEVLSFSNEEAYKEKLLKQSLNVYAKVSLPIDYDRQLKPAAIVEDILSDKNIDEERVKLQFI